ncbi:SDR family oxidoreductase [Bogoriella caseilytica]|uniref:Putative NAD(P)-binding protein n=1 Tax=Bogoriella caseilytica TaxID=56055 RepID=A0A3N2B9G6_9MICO|nr:SDR family oxidoreductase [Bogoriella caseilytica]ROR71906.1 putative NAD(P)-binding protein [Bogoriella caseilytica]
MRIAIAGGHGKIARHLTRQLSSRGDAVVGIIRNPDHEQDLREDGAEPVVLDLERASIEEVAQVLRGVDAVVFAAGAGPGSGAERKDTVDRGAAVLLADAAEAAGVRRYLMVSSMGADAGGQGIEDKVFAAYQEAKKAADEDLMARDLEWTIVRPGGLSDDPGTGLVHIARHTGRGSIPREDVASVLRTVLDDPTTSGLVFEVISGQQLIATSLRALRD